MSSSVCVLVSVDRLQLVPWIADALEGIGPGVTVTTRPCEPDPGSRSSARYQEASNTEGAGDSFVLQVKSEEREVLADVEVVLGQWAARHPLTVRFKLFSEW